MEDVEFLTDAEKQLILGVVDPEQFGRELRLPGDGTRTAVFSATWKTLPGDNFSGLPVLILMRQDNDPNHDATINMPVRTPPNSLTIFRKRHAVDCLIVEDKNLTAGAALYLIQDVAGSTALRIDLASGLSCRASEMYGGAIYYPGYFNRPIAQYGAPWHQSVYNLVGTGLNIQANQTTAFQGFAAYRAAHSAAQGVLIHPVTKRRYVYLDGSMLAKPGFPNYLSPNPGPSQPGGLRKGVGLSGYICATLDNAVPPPAPFGGTWITEASLAAGNAANYDELFYLTTGCIAILIPPLLPVGHAGILPGGVNFHVKIYCLNRGAERLLTVGPTGQTLNNMAPGDAIFVWPVWFPDFHRAEVVFWVDDPAKQGTFYYSILYCSLGEFWGHRFAPGLLTNSQSTFAPSAVAKVTFQSDNTQENIASFDPADVRPTSANASYVTQPVSNPTATGMATRVIGSALQALNNTATQSNSTVTTVTLPSGMSWLTVTDRPKYTENPLPKPFGLQGNGAASIAYTDPYISLGLLSRHTIDVACKDDEYKSFMPLGTLEEMRLRRDIQNVRMMQRELIAGGLPEEVFPSEFTYSFPMDLRVTVTVIGATASNVFQVSPANRQAAINASPGPLDYRIRITVGGEYTTSNQWMSQQVSTMLHSELSRGAYVLTQIDTVGVGVDAFRQMVSRLPPHLRDALIEYMSRNIAAKSFKKVRFS